MARYFVHLAFRGAPFHGWQAQPGATTVQGVLEDAFSTLVHTHISVTGAGRTDAGVNAAMMVAHVDLPDTFDAGDPAFLRSLNAIVGSYIALHGIYPVSADAHARFDATEREYRYFVHAGKNPFLEPLSWQIPRCFDFDAMNEAAALLVGRRDFTSFAKLHSDAKTNICDVRSAQWLSLSADRWCFTIVADRFLRNMVRAIVGTLAAVGRGKLPPAAVIDILDRHDRCAAGTSMPPEPLFLWRIEYSYPIR